MTLLLLVVFTVLSLGALVLGAAGHVFEDGAPAEAAAAGFVLCVLGVIVAGLVSAVWLVAGLVLGGALA